MGMVMGYQLALTTCADQGSAEALAETLLEQHLAACVTILPGARSLYRWQGRVEYEAELVLLIKTRTDRFEALRACLLEHHPYELPELIAVPIESGSPAYLNWINQQLDK